MDITLRVTPEALKTKASEVEDQIKALENHFNSIQDLVARSTGYWVGVAGDKARRDFNNQKDDTQMVLKRFREHPVDLLTMAGVYTESEREITSTNQALDTDVIA